MSNLSDAAHRPTGGNWWWFTHQGAWAHSETPFFWYLRTSDVVATVRAGPGVRGRSDGAAVVNVEQGTGTNSTAMQKKKKLLLVTRTPTSWRV